MALFKISMLPNAIAPEEHLFRAIKDGNPNLWKDGRPTSAAFKDSQGLSVNRQGDRTIAESCDVARQIYADTKVVVHLSSQECINLGGMPQANPVAGNEYHALIIDGNSAITLTSPVAKRIARGCLICYLKPEVEVAIVEDDDL